MRFSTLTAFGLSAAILAGCGGPADVSYRLTFDTQDPGQTEELSKASIRVMQRRLDNLGADLTGQTISKDADGVTVNLTVSSSAAADELTYQMTAPFDLQIMALAESATGADLTVEGMGGFNATGVTGDDIEMVRAGTNPETKGGYVIIDFTDAGTAKMEDIFASNVGNSLGLFVRGKLVSGLDVLSADLPDPLVIGGIPEPAYGQIFADDVNVGIHVTVSPL